MCEHSCPTYADWGIDVRFEVMDEVMGKVKHQSKVSDKVTC